MATIGLISAINSFVYIVSPVLLRGFLRKLGTGRGLKITSVLVALNFSFILLVPSPESLLIVYILDGIFSSALWSLLNANAATWHEQVPDHLRASFVRGYGLSWNLGALAGELTGFLLSLTGIHDGLIACIGLLGVWMQIWFVFRLEVPSRGASGTGKPEHAPLAGNAKEAKPGRLLKASFAVVALVLVGEFTSQVIKGAYGFLLPVVLSQNGAWPGLVYLASLLQRVAQLGGVSMNGKGNKDGRTFKANLALVVMLIATIQVLANGSVLAFMLTTVVVGFCLGMVTTHVSGMLFTLAGNDPTLKLATTYEMVSGAGYSITLFIASSGPAGHEMSILWFVVVVVVVVLAIAYAGMASRMKIGNSLGLGSHLASPSVRTLHLTVLSRSITSFLILSRGGSRHEVIPTMIASGFLHDNYLSERFKQSPPIFTDH